MDLGSGLREEPMKFYPNMTLEHLERWFSGIGWVLRAVHRAFRRKPVGFHYHDTNTEEILTGVS
jgi:hypothetical protein